MDSRLNVFPDGMEAIRRSTEAMALAIDDKEKVQELYDGLECFMNLCGEMLAWAVLTNAGDQ